MTMREREAIANNGFVGHDTKRQKKNLQFSDVEGAVVQRILLQRSATFQCQLQSDRLERVQEFATPDRIRLRNYKDTRN